MDKITDAFAEIGAALARQKAYTEGLEKENEQLRGQVAALLQGVGIQVSIAHPETGEESYFYLAPARPVDLKSLNIPVHVVPDMHKQLDGSFLLDTGAVQAVKHLGEKLVS